MHMHKNVSMVMIIGLLWMAFQGCTRLAWYEGLKEQQRKECYTYTNQSEIQECLDRIGDTSFDEYERSRTESIPPAE
jgi:hypothetical protein